MSLNIGIVGLEMSGRTTIFNCLTSMAADTSRSRQEEHVGIARVPDFRVDRLKEMFKSRKAVYGEVKYVDLGASLKNAAKDFALSGKLLSGLGATDALLCVIRAFKDESVPHPQGSIDPARDIEAMELELAFSDMAIIERRLEKLAAQLKAARITDRPMLEGEAVLLEKIKLELEAGTPVRRQSLGEEDLKKISSYQFLSLKPLLTVLNIGEEQLGEARQLEEQLDSRFGDEGHRIVALAGKLEMELAGLDEESRQVFLDEFQIKEPGLQKVIRASFDLLGLISFLTTGEDESRAWPLPLNTYAPQAAGRIHSDIERGFIRAEVVHYDDLIRLGGYAGARKEGLFRVEGKNYIVQDGDVINFLFNV
ncbi:MAG: redox-regulated ATPase YchF [Dehalococcoidales bacterium]|jgi:GTP-binding protein YchF|nr:redox-regulated ATPase YchF [Dehalococcoidales bacterium]MDD5605095.1 redox-regulated ATPase YchF [Dehalococcoidales bacterium]MDX9985880.1 redox-regulated ATPase YchF [Dehalococcoidales bacterium]